MPTTPEELREIIAEYLTQHGVDKTAQAIYLGLADASTSPKDCEFKCRCVGFDVIAWGDEHSIFNAKEKP